MGNIISASSTAADHLIPTRLTRPQHLQQEFAATIGESSTHTNEEEHSVDVDGNTSINIHNGDGNDSSGHNQLHNNIDNPNGGNRNDPHIIRTNTARLHDPKVTAYVLRFYLHSWGIVCVKLIGGNPMLLSNIANPFMIFSLVAFCMALLILSLLSWMFEHSEENSAGPSSCYMILKGVYYVFCKLAFFSLILAVLFTTN